MKKILIANRGEIARRIQTSVRKLGLASVAVYSPADAQWPFVKEADQRFALQGNAPKDSYLDTEQILKICRENEVDAIHPGFGFLAENSEFARVLKKNKIEFIGPEPDQIIAMGDKIQARKIMTEAGVPVVPGFQSEGDNQDVNNYLKEAEKIGYPVMIKATAGGGGKGMRMVSSAADFAESFEAAKREAAGAFGNDHVFLEKFIINPRHIEVQILGDGTGKVIHLGERECSLQRRHQKVIEEAPSPFVDEKLRQKITEAAVLAGKSINYKSAGTVEFIVGQDGSFYFLEMNTRIQVEHSVTEMITGVDLIEWMIRIARGEKLSLNQSDIKLNGWAMEARLYAEDPANQFFPCSGTLEWLEFPAPQWDAQQLGSEVAIRIDSGVVEGNEISVFYDPMIAKLTSFGKDRQSAIATLIYALENTIVFGLKQNRAFLIQLLKNKQFQKGNMHTGFIAEVFPDGFDEQEENRQALMRDPNLQAALALNVMLGQNEEQNANMPQVNLTALAGDDK